ncbi:MAG: hypothetical protein AN484_20410 [Aphanizomenon flos-aquae WA102]|uniref:Uncharacterized protein n=1 Tax=Aphanizomenon flos-aquae WA102 TaxID=1710896 RepID=A0A1B7WX31_APHFL|nr:MAG: hypothetical protein AN484_20410 [Aphanizomenon flos-aquae WA102]
MAPGPPNKGPRAPTLSASRYRLEPPGRWPLAAGRWPLAAGRWPLAVCLKPERLKLEAWGGRGLAARQKVTGATNPLKKVK